MPIVVTDNKARDLLEKMIDDVIKDRLLYGGRGPANMTWVLDWVKENFDPKDVFSEEELENWARGHGWEPES